MKSLKLSSALLLSISDYRFFQLCRDHIFSQAIKLVPNKARGKCKNNRKPHAKKISCFFQLNKKVTELKLFGLKKR